MKMFICVVGVTGCMTLILSSFAVKDSVDLFAGQIKTNEHNYDVMLSLDRTVRQEEYEHIGKMAVVDKVQHEMTAMGKIYTADRQETVRLTVTDDIVELKLLEIYGPPIDMLPENGIVMEHDLAEKLDYSIGEYSRNSYDMKFRFEFFQKTKIVNSCKFLKHLQELTPFIIIIRIKIGFFIG